MRRRISRRQARQRGGQRLFRWLALAAAGLLAAYIFLVETEVKPRLDALGEYHCRAIVAEAMNAAVAEALAREPALVDTLYQVEHGPDGRVSAVQSDAAALNAARVALVGAVQAAQVALDGFTACQEAVAAGGAGMAEMYRADEALDSAINLLYGQMQELADDPLDMGAVGQQYGRFNSAGTVLGSLHYNEAVLDYQKDTGGPWASVLKGLFGIKEVEVFG